MCKQKMVRYNVWLCGRVTVVATEDAEWEWASARWEDALIVSANRLDVWLIDSAPVLHPVAKVLEAHICICSVVISATISQEAQDCYFFYFYGIARAVTEMIFVAKRKYMNLWLSNPLYSSCRAWGKSKWYIVTWGWIPGWKGRKMHGLSLHSWTFENPWSLFLDEEFSLPRD
jgi:hypothetical protein